MASGFHILANQFAHFDVWVVVVAYRSASALALRNLTAKGAKNAKKIKSTEVNITKDHLKYVTFSLKQYLILQNSFT